jgi:hypothetical protein
LNAELQEAVTSKTSQMCFIVLKVVHAWMVLAVQMQLAQLLEQFAKINVQQNNLSISVMV